MVLFVIVVGYGNRHRWYQLPLVPIAATFAGAACAFIGSKSFLACCCGHIVDPAGQFVHDLWLLVRATTLSIIARSFAMPV